MCGTSRAEIKTTFAVLLLLASGFAVSHETLRRALAFTHVTVIDATGAPACPNMTVVVMGQRIVEVEKTRDLRPPPGAIMVEARGKYLIPGLWDMHVHTAFGDWLPANERVTLPLFVANGVTGVRDMGSDLGVIKQWRSDIEAGRLLGPKSVGLKVSTFDPDRSRSLIALLAIANTRRIRAVVLAGRYFDRPDLGRMLRGVARAAAETEAPATADESKRTPMPTPTAAPTPIQTATPARTTQTSAPIPTPGGTA